MIQELSQLPEVHNQMRTHRLPPAKNRSRPTARTILARIPPPRPVHPRPEDVLSLAEKLVRRLSMKSPAITCSSSAMP